MISSKKMKFAVTTAAATAIVCTSALAANMVSTSDLNVRTGPGTSYSVKTVIKKGTPVTKVAQYGNWAKIQVNGTTGYASLSYLDGLTGSSSSTTTPSNSSKTVYVTASSLNVRSGAGTNYSVIGNMQKGASATVVGSSNGWYKVKYGSGYGYISSKYTSSSKPSGGSSAATPSTPSASSKTMYCNVSGLNVRSGKGTAYASKGSLAYGQAVTVVDTSSYWYKIKYGNDYGYVGSKYLSSSKPAGGSSATTPTPPSSNKGKTVYCTVSGLNVRSGKGTQYSTVGSLSYGQAVTVVDTSNYWYKIKYGNGYGYASSKYLSSSKPSGSTEVTPPTTDASSNGSSIVSYAKQFLGCSYVYGGNGPSSFDCSGFTKYVYAHFGKSIPRSSSAQYASAKKISKSNLQPGDLVFFTNGGSSVGHVAIYMGNGQIIHAANPSRGVCIDSLNSSYYSQHYVGSGRY